jgi:hypothetical protein
MHLEAPILSLFTYTENFTRWPSGSAPIEGKGAFQIDQKANLDR